MLKTLNAKYHQGTGKIRRLLLVSFQRRYIFKQLRKRQGQCVRCGTCCKLLFHCPFLKTGADGLTTCTIHVHRPANCRIFPINEKDIFDRDTRNPQVPCGYHF